jgi:SAM-dependent methyltransferase/uncharacterized protein YbaR (Trm112 family)
MRWRHWEQLRPLCLRCRHDHDEAVPLGEPEVQNADGDDVLDALLPCPQCGTRFPVLDGIPILVADLPAFLRSQAHDLVADRGGSPLLAAFLHEQLGMASVLTERRAVRSVYAWAHWGDALATPLPTPGDVPPGDLLALLAQFGRIDPALGPVLDAACGAGRASWEVASPPGACVLGVDLSLDLLRLGRARLRGEPISVPFVRAGLATECRTLRSIEPRPAADLWCADVSDLPFATSSFGTVLSLNALDSVLDPGGHLGEAARVLRAGGALLLATPFDWHAHVTPEAAWIGGHGAQHGDPVAALGVLVEGTGLLDHVASRGGLPWRLRRSDRALDHRLCWAGSYVRRE